MGSSPLDLALGLQHYLFDRPPKEASGAVAHRSHANPYLRGDLPLVSKVKAGSELKASVAVAVGLLGGFGPAIKSGDRVLVKPNFNSPDPFPASTSLDFLQAAVELLKDAGAKVSIGDSAGGLWRPTRRVFEKTGVDRLARALGTRLIPFDEPGQEWLRIETGGSYLPSVTVPRLAYEADKLVYLPCLKTHKLARFTGALKLGVGFMHPGERRALHAGPHFEEKAVEINLCFQPALIIMDARKVFVTGGPDQGKVEEPGLILASGDLAAIDVEGVKVLLGYPAKNRLPEDPWSSPQVAAARRHGLGGVKGEYVLVP
jgi:uncharacterized protein (DUF362 family)